MKAKGVESRHFTGYVVQPLNENADAFGYHFKRLREAGQTLLSYYRIMSDEERVLTSSAHQALMDNCINFLECYRLAGGPMVPKCHGFVHLTQSACLSGNPAYTSTAQDESDNGICKAVAERVHGLTWISSVFERLEVLELLEVDLLDCALVSSDT